MYGKNVQFMGWNIFCVGCPSDSEIDWISRAERKYLQYKSGSRSAKELMMTKI